MTNMEDPRMTTDQPRRTLNEHVAEGLDAIADRARRTGMDPAVIDAWRDGPHNLVLMATADPRGAAIDTRSTLFSVVTTIGDAPRLYEVAQVRGRDLDDEDGQPLDHRRIARDLMAQQQPAPDYVPTEWTVEGGDAA